jgi:AcrR family transcriptional regulator
VILIYKNFLSLAPEKQVRIQNAALAEFGRYGYQKTSVEQIAKKAEIAKGMIFHYFGNKMGMFEYLLNTACQYMKERFDGLEDQIKALDYIEQYRYLTKIKLESYLQNPFIFEFFTMLYAHPENLKFSPKAATQYQEMLAMRQQLLSSMQAAQGTWYFRADISHDKIKRYISWLLDGYSQSLLVQLSETPFADLDLEPYWAEFDEILDDLKDLFYYQTKPEVLL